MLKFVSAYVNGNAVKVKVKSKVIPVTGFGGL
jgi:hypothetical protein